MRRDMTIRRYLPIYISSKPQTRINIINITEPYKKLQNLLTDLIFNMAL